MGYLLGSHMTRKEARSPPGSWGHSARPQSSPFHHLGAGDAPTSSGRCTTAYWEAPRAEHKLWRVWRNDGDGFSEKKKPPQRLVCPRTLCFPPTDPCSPAPHCAGSHGGLISSRVPHRVDLLPHHPMLQEMPRSMSSVPRGTAARLQGPQQRGGPVGSLDQPRRGFLGESGQLTGPASLCPGRGGQWESSALTSEGQERQGCSPAQALSRRAASVDGCCQCCAGTSISQPASS